MYNFTTGSAAVGGFKGQGFFSSAGLYIKVRRI